MLMDHLRLPVFALASLVLAGCAATPTVQQVRPIEADLSRFTSLQVTVDAAEHIRGKPGYDITSAELQREFMANVAATGKFATVGTEKQPGRSLEARLMITDLNYVSGAARGGIGILAGRAVLNVTMTLKDIDTAQDIGAITAAHASSHGQGVFSPVTSTQITAIAKEFSLRLTGK
jgi:hypothetical protein